MSQLQTICSLLDNIKEKLLKYEQETIDIITCDIDSVQGHTEERVSITQQMDEVFKQIDEICDSIDGGDTVRKIIRNVSQFPAVESKYNDVYFKAQELFSIVTRIKDSDVQAVGRINLEKDILRKKIKDVNNGREAQASKFLVGTNGDGNKRHFNDSTKSI